MKKSFLCLGLSLGVLSPGLLAQQGSMSDMPGMTMPKQQSNQPPDSPIPQHPQPNPKPRAGRPNRNQAPAEAMPQDMKSMGNDAGNRKALQNSMAEQNSVQQQKGQIGIKPGQGSDQQSLQLPIQDLQEPEGIDLRTGQDLPAPELLGEVVQREPMLLEQFLALADKSNPTLSQAQRNVDRSLQQAHQVSLPPDPILGYSGDHIRGGEYHGGEQGAFFTQEFVLGHKLALRRDIYRAEGKANLYALEVQRARVHNDVARAFFDSLAAQQSVVLHDRLLKVALDADTNTHELARLGQADAPAILTAEVAVEQARIDFVQAQRMFLAHYAQLAALAGQRTHEVHPLKGSLVDPPAFHPEDYVQRDTEESPLVKQAQADVAVSEMRLKDARRERIPNLNLTAGEWYSGEEVSSGAKAGWESFAQAGVQLPLWNHNQGNIEAAKALVQRANDNVQRARLWTRQQTEPLAQEYLTAHFTAERYRTQMIPRARRAYQLEVTKYQQMSQEYPPVLSAQRMLFTLQLGYTEALNQEWRAAIALQNYALMNGLDAPAGEGSDSTTVNVPTNAGTN